MSVAPPLRSETEKGRFLFFMYAIIETGGKQFKVSSGDIIFVEKLDAETDSTVEFNTVAVGGEGDISLNSGVKVTGKVLKQGKAKKITVFTYKRKKGKQRKLGHRQPYTKVQIGEIG